MTRAIPLHIPSGLAHALTAIFLACLSLTTGAEPVPEQLTTAAEMDNHGAWDYRLDSGGGLWLAYYDAGRLLRIREPEGAERLVVPEKTGQAPSGIAMAALDSDVAILWRDKLPTKGLFLGRGRQGDRATIELAGDTQPLARMLAERTGEYLDLLWLGEKAFEGATALHHIYHRRVRLTDEALSPIERVLPGIYPVWARDEEGALIVFSWVSGEPEGSIVARSRPATAKAFREPVTVAAVPGITPIFRALRSGERWLVLWLAQYSMAPSDFLLEGAYSDDEGATWRRFAFEELRGHDMASLDVAADGQGHIAIAVTARRRHTEPEEKQNVFLLRSSDRGTTWSPPLPLRPLGQLAAFQAKHPSVSFASAPGALLVVWEDWREIRSRLYASLSLDYGATWRYDNVPLPHAPEVNLGLRQGISAIFTQGDRFNVIAEQAVDDSLRRKKLVRLSFTVEDLARLAGEGQATDRAHTGGADAAAGADQTEDALRDRIDEFWKRMVNAEYGDAYAFYDPFFRSRNPIDAFKSTMGRIQYSGYEIGEVRLTGPRAEVETKVRASIGPFRAPTTGETISRPEQEVTVPEIWLWVDDNWYREFRSEAQDLVYTRY